MARKILLADDSVTAQNMGRKILADAGYEVIAVNNGSAALKKIAELKPDLVILDVYMPGYSGLEVCQRLKEAPETARIPVLLSVGKLEPFKPEEAQRVRADAFIVKPFEASELLSALSKLEDKVVPRSEPSKPGRFARAIAAAEESSRSSRKETASDPNGWNKRIGFPHEKTGTEEKVADDSSIYNPMNRDLRTVVETPAEKAAEKREEEQSPEVSEAVVDVAALAPVGLPKDVTPEEVAAITAAAAQIQMAGAAVKDEPPVGGSESFDTPAADPQISETPVAQTSVFETQTPETKTPETQTFEAANQESSAPPADRVEDHFVPPAYEEAKTEVSQESQESEVAAAEFNVKGNVSPEETQDLPVTMAAATSESAAAVSVEGSLWTAVPMALEGEEATTSLEEEMQRAYAAYAPYVAAEADSSSDAGAQEVEAATAENSSLPESLPEIASVVVAEPVESFSSPEVATFVADAEASSNTFAEPSAEPAPVPEPESSAVQTVVADAAVVAEAQESDSQHLNSWPEAEPAMAEATPASSDFAVAVATHEPVAEYKPDSETVKSAAAAWASWRQIRDTRKDGEVAQSQSKEFEVSESVPAEAAMAVAAGAEQIAQAVPSAPASEPVDIASIVESVLANLRPKLMEEISRKMAEKK